jgi:5'-3' exonuclease
MGALGGTSCLVERDGHHGLHEASMSGDQQQLFGSTVQKQQPLTPTDHQPDRGLCVAVDGNSVVHRAWWAYQRSGLQDADGQAVFASHGFLKALGNICSQIQTTTGVQPDQLIVAFDDSRSIRCERWPTYKQGRSERDPDVGRQLRFIAEVLCKQLGLATVIAPGWEADDVCASVATQGARCVVASSDRDFYALISPTVQFAKLGNGSAVDLFGEAEFLTRFGFAAGQYRDFAALRGDPSDNLRGVAGIGEKTAAKILSRSPVSDILEDPDAHIAALGAAAVKKLLAGAEEYRRNVEVMTMQTGLDVSLETGFLAGIDPDQIRSVCAHYGISNAGRSFLTGVCAPVVERF